MDEYVGEWINGQMDEETGACIRQKGQNGQQPEQTSA